LPINLYPFLAEKKREEEEKFVEHFHWEAGSAALALSRGIFLVANAIKRDAILRIADAASCRGIR